MGYGGSAVVIGLMRLLAARKAKVRVGVVGLVENMPSGTAQRPGGHRQPRCRDRRSKF